MAIKGMYSQWLAGDGYNGAQMQIMFNWQIIAIEMKLNRKEPGSM